MGSSARRARRGDETAARIREVTALEELGAEVLVLTADVSDEDQMRAALASATAQFGPVHGVIHAAGVAGGGMMQLKRPDAAAAVLAPKTHGALVLESVLGETPLDFLLLCSSTIAFSGGLGQVDYCGRTPSSMPTPSTGPRPAARTPSR
ncbi:ketoreductase domain-containing protein [Streptomyces sp. M10(2022)]